MCLPPKHNFRPMQDVCHSWWSVLSRVNDMQRLRFGLLLVNGTVHPLLDGSHSPAFPRQWRTSLSFLSYSPKSTCPCVIPLRTNFVRCIQRWSVRLYRFTCWDEAISLRNAYAEVVASACTSGILGACSHHERQKQPVHVPTVIMNLGDLMDTKTNHPMVHHPS